MVKLLYLELIYGAEGARAKFEDLCSHLIRSQFPDMDVQDIRTSQGDGGIDVYVGTWANPIGIDVFQAKFFDRGLGEGQKGQIRSSFNTCLANTNFKTRSWTLCLPIDLTIEEMKWFSAWKQETASKKLLARNINVWGARKLEGILDEPQNKGTKEAFFQEEHLTHIREMHGMIVELTKEIVNFMGGPTQETVKMQLRKYLESNLRKAQVLLEGEYPLERFDLAQRTTIESQTLITFATLYSRVVDVFQALEHGNRLADAVVTMYSNPKLPMGRDALAGFTGGDFYQHAYHMIIELKKFIAQEIIPQLQTLLGDMKEEQSK